MTAPTDVDVRHADGRLAASLLLESDHESWNWGRASLDEVRANLSSTGYPDALVRYIPGPIEDTIPREAPERISLLRLDTDWYASTRHELIHLFPRLVAGGVLIIDDYGHWEGAKRAVDEYIDEIAMPLLLCRIDYTARIAVKPFLAQ